MKSQVFRLCFHTIVILLVSFPCLDLVHAQFGKNAQFFAQYAIDGGTESEFTIHNPGDGFLNAELSLFSSTGELVHQQTVGLPARSSETIVLGGPGGAPTDGWARLIAPSAIAASLYYRIPGVGTVGVLPSALTTRARLLPASAEAAVGLALANPGNVPARLTFRIISVFGSLGREEERTLAPGEHFALFASQEPIAAEAGEAVEVLSTQPIVATALRLEDGFLSGTGLILPELPIRAEFHGGTPSLIGGHADNALTRALNGAVIGGGGDESGPNLISDEFSTIGGGLENEAGNGDENGKNSAYATVGGGTENLAAGLASVVGGGSGNAALSEYSTVAGGEGNDAEGSRSFVGGGSMNLASGSFAGVAAGERNRATSGAAFVGGGRDNLAGGSQSVVCGGLRNLASGLFSTVCGGADNTASGNAAAVLGGGNNQASGIDAVIVGGSRNRAAGNHSLAAGQRGVASHDGSFVWSGLSQTEIESSATNEFTARAQGGVRFFTNDAGTTGVALAQGGGSWSMVSDKNLKRDFEKVDIDSVLTRLSNIPLTTWSYKSQNESIRHIGPMAQDFFAAFGLGSDERKITTVDGIGISLAAIQGLHQQLQDKEERIQRLETLLEQVLEKLQRD